MKNYLAEKMDLMKVRFRTKEGWFHILIGSAVYGFVIISYTELIKMTLQQFFSFVTIPFIKQYLVYLTFGLLLTPIGIGITYILSEVYKFLEKFKKNFR